MGRLSLDESFAALRECLETSDESELITGLRKFLADKSNLVVERTADAIGDRNLTAMATDLRSTYDRLLVKPVKTDAGCIAKTAICAALRALTHEDSEFFREQASYTQFEPYFGGLEDKAGNLRAECILALVELRAPGFMEAAIDMAHDDLPAARGAAIRGIANAARPEAAMLLRMKALARDASPEVMGETFSGLIHCGADQLEFVGRFLNDADVSVVSEAALALAESKHAEVVPLIVARWKRSPHGPLSQTFFTALALCRHEDAVRALGEIAATQELEIAKQAMSAMQQSPREDLVRSVMSELLAECHQSERINFFQQLFPPEP